MVGRPLVVVSFRLDVEQEAPFSEFYNHRYLPGLMHDVPAIRSAWRYQEHHVAGSLKYYRKQFLTIFECGSRPEAEQALLAPWLSYELHDETGLLLAAGGEDTARLGWREESGERLLRLAVDRLPVADGVFRLRFGLAAGEGGSWYHLLDDAVEFVVHPASDGKGALRLEGSWSMQEIAAGGGNPH